MAQNNTPKAKPKDVANDTGRSPLENESKTEPADLKSDNQEAEFLDSFELIDAIEEIEPASSASSLSKSTADFFDGLTLKDEVQAAVPSPPESASEEKGLSATIVLTDEVQAPAPPLSEPEPDTDTDFDPDHVAVITARVPESLHRELLSEAKKEGVSLNQLCLTKLARPLD
jgi:hypothetical protein